MKPSGDHNHILSGLPHETRAIVERAAEPTKLSAETVLIRAGTPTADVYFVETGFLSAMMDVPDHTGVEIGLIGREGMAGSWLVLGEDAAPFDIVVRKAGGALRISTSVFMEACRRHLDLQTSTLAYCHRFTRMVAESCQAQAKLTVEGRLARWLLLAHDRMDDDAVTITHETLSRMLGVRRPGVTVALHVLEGEHTVKSTRGQIRILDREKLGHFARSPYRDVAARKLEAIAELV